MAASINGATANAATDFLSWGIDSARWLTEIKAEPWQTVAAGGYHVLVLTADGAVHAWGDNYYGQCNTPWLDDFVSIAAGRYHNLALRQGGAIVVWGDNSRGQCRAPTEEGFIAVGSGWWHCLAIQSDGTLAAWGWNERGQCNVPTGATFTAVCGGHSHSLALGEDGTIVAWGSNADGQCDVPAGDDFVGIAAGAYHSLGLRTDGSIVAWGRNDFGQCEVPAERDFEAIAAGACHNLALRCDGTVLAWGYNDYGQCDASVGDQVAVIAAGSYLSLGLADGFVQEMITLSPDPPEAPPAIDRMTKEEMSDRASTVDCAREQLEVVSMPEAAPTPTDALPAAPEVLAVDSAPLEDSSEALPQRAELRLASAAGESEAAGNPPAREPEAPRRALETASPDTGAPGKAPEQDRWARYHRAVRDVMGDAPVVLAICAGVGLGGVCVLLVLAGRVARILKVRRQQRQERSGEMLWTIMLEDDQRRLLAEPDDV